MTFICYHVQEIDQYFAGILRVRRELLIKHREWVGLMRLALLQMTIISL